MRAVDANYEIMAVNGESEELAEKCGRICYKSEPKGDAGAFIRARVGGGHETVVGHITHCFAISSMIPSWRKQDIYKLVMDTPGFYLSEIPGKIITSMNAQSLRRAVMEGSSTAGYLLAKIKPQFPNTYYGVWPEGAHDPLEFMEVLSSEERLALPSPDLFLHNYMTVKFTCDRGVSHELVRHRLAVYSQESTRWVNFNNTGISIIHPKGLTETQRARREDHFWQTQAIYEAEIAEGQPPQIARGVLPTALSTTIAMTATFHEWRLVFNQRSKGTTGKPHPQMKELMDSLLVEAAYAYPNAFGDLL